MKVRHILVCMQCMIFSPCYGMGHYFEKFVDTMYSPAQRLVAWTKNEDRLLNKPALSPLPTLVPELLKTIALKLDGKAMSHFASCCSSINQKLNASHHGMVGWHQNDMHAPLKIVKGYVAHNEKLIETFSEYPSAHLQTPAFKNFFAQPFTDFNYCRIQKSHWDGVMFDTGSYATTPKYYTLDKDEKEKLDALFGPRTLVVHNMVHILCATARYPESVRFLLEQRADSNCPHGVFSPIQGALSGFIHEDLFPGDDTRCTHMVNILLDHKADIQYKEAGYNYLHILSEYKHAFLLIPYFTTIGIDINETNAKGNTPLFTCAKANKSILEKDADFFRSANQFLITDYAFLHSVRLLIAARADPTLRNHDNESLFDCVPPYLHKHVQAIIDKQ